MDYNDIYCTQDPSHPGDIIPAALMLAELGGLGGRDLILGTIIGHELEMRCCEAGMPGRRELIMAFEHEQSLERFFRLTTTQGHAPCH